MKFVKTADKFSKKALPINLDSVKTTSDELIKKATKKLQGTKDEENEVIEEKEEKVEIKLVFKKSEEKQQKASRKDKQDLEVTFDVKEDLKNFKTE